MGFQEGKEEQLRTIAGIPLLLLLCGKEQNSRKRQKHQFGQINLVSLL